MYGLPLGGKFNDANVMQWIAKQIAACLAAIDGMSLRLSEVRANIEFYREHARYAIGDAIKRKKTKQK